MSYTRLFFYLPLPALLLLLRFFFFLGTCISIPYGIISLAEGGSYRSSSSSTTLVLGMGFLLDLLTALVVVFDGSSRSLLYSYKSSSVESLSHEDITLSLLDFPSEGTYKSSSMITCCVLWESDTYAKKLVAAPRMADMVPFLTKF
jgi:hypothetical protein